MATCSELIIDLTAATNPSDTEVEELKDQLQRETIVIRALIEERKELPTKKGRKRKNTTSTEKQPKAAKISKTKKVKAPKYPPCGYCVAGIDIGLKNFSTCIMRQSEMNKVTNLPERPQILDWRNSNLYADREGGKIIKYEAADKLLSRLEKHLNEIGERIGSWEIVNEVNIESQAASTNAIRRVETMVFAYFHFRYPSIQVKTISASRKLSLVGMTHEKEDSATYKGRKKLAVHYGRLFMKEAPEDCPFKHILDPFPRKKKGEVRTVENKADDLGDTGLMCMYVLGVPVTTVGSISEVQ